VSEEIFRDHTLILKNIGKHISLDKEETDYFISLLRYKEVAKKDFLLREGETGSKKIAH
jgi:hypothetical protein